MYRRLMAAAATATLAVSLSTACGTSGDDSSGTDTVSVGVIPILDVAPIYLGRQQGIFDKHGIELELSTGQGGAALIPGVVSGEQQFGFSNVTSLLLARDRGLPLRMVTAGAASTSEEGEDFGAVAVKGDSELDSAADLADKRVAVNTLNNIGDTVIRESVRQDGGDPSAVQFVDLGFPEMPAALENEHIDAAFLVEPFLSIARKQGAEVVAWTYAEATPNLTVATYFTSEQLAASDPDLVKRFRQAMEESQAYASDNPDAAREVLKTYTEIDEELIPDLTLPAYPTEINRASVRKLAELAVTDGLIEKQPDLDALLPK